MTQEYLASYPADPANVAKMRAWVRGVLADALGVGRSSVVADDVQLVVSELVTNSLDAGSSSLDVTIAVDDTHVRVGLTDDAPGEPTPKQAEPSDAHGRGLAIVAALAADWGVRRGARGKEVWATLALP
ncbi:MAG TPA: ATP-binding protein [Jatrophihabitans sp.]|uniref:ATP-binding protein n=1 Tax=Jatrophihabitans sp. TaxID=1932789 RepID=UPI002E0405C6|nr:ATP-binding protein [Jatrophihabitans sp.]